MSAGAGVGAGKEGALRRRTQLFVPGNRPDRAVKAAAAGADAVIVDLEDSVPPGERAGARAGLGEFVRAVRGLDGLDQRGGGGFDGLDQRGGGGLDGLDQQGELDHWTGLHVVVRVDLPSLEEDLRAAVAAQVDSVLVPKVESPEQVLVVERILQDAEGDSVRPNGPTEVQLLVETPKGLLAVAAIAAAGRRTTAMVLGTEDLAAELEVDPAGPDTDLRWAHGQLLVAARAHGLAPYGLIGSLAELRDLDVLRRSAEVSRAFGYVGSLAIHPAQVEVMATAFAPTPAEVDHARRVLEAMAAAEAQGRAAAQVDGRMVDIPVADRARRLLARAGVTV